MNQRIANHQPIYSIEHDKLRVFNDTPLCQAMEIYKYVLTVTDPTTHFTISNFFYEIHQLYSKYLLSEQVKNDLQQRLDQLSNSLVPTDPTPVEDQQQNTSFRDFLIQNSAPEEVQTVLRDIVEFNKSAINLFIRDRSKELDWEEFAFQLMGIEKNHLNRKRTPCSKVVQYIEEACEKNYALRSKNIEEVVQNIIRARELVNTN